MIFLSFLHFFLALALAPLLLGAINKTKAFFAGRTGQPLAQTYYDLWRLLHKGAVYSRSTTWMFRAGPIVGLACAIAALAIMPSGSARGVVSFGCDLVFMAYLFGLSRFFTVIAALDTASSFEGMGASREVQFSALAEPALFLALAAAARLTRCCSLSGISDALSMSTYLQAGPVLALAACSLLIVFLTENSRIPMDDPNTHLELTMIHEVMVLDHSGPDLAFISYGAALKLWTLGALLVNIALPIRTGFALLDSILFLLAMFLLAVLVGVIESSMARLRLLRAPRLLVGAIVLSGLAFVLLLR
jgi:formate hydrogenlyase subunit 4